MKAKQPNHESRGRNSPRMEGSPYSACSVGRKRGRTHANGSKNIVGREGPSAEGGRNLIPRRDAESEEKGKVILFGSGYGGHGSGKWGLGGGGNRLAGKPIV